MHLEALQGVTQGGKKRTATPDDLVNRNFSVPGPSVLWVSDLTYVWTASGLVHVAYVIDAYARRIAGWRASNSLPSNLVLDALERALHARDRGRRLIVHRDRESHYLSIRYTERLAQVGVAA